MIHWLTTAPNPRTPATGFDAGQRGWRLHAILAPSNATIGEVNGLRAVCGLKPKHGWGLDLFIERRCASCEVKLGLPLSEANRFAKQLRAEFRAERKSRAGV